MLQVHTEGRAIVATGNREAMERHVAGDARLRPAGHGVEGRAVIVAGRSGGEGVRIVLEAEEAMLLSELADQVDSVLLLGEADDPALGRLLPNAYPDDARVVARVRPLHARQPRRRQAAGRAAGARRDRGGGRRRHASCRSSSTSPRRGAG